MAGYDNIKDKGFNKRSTSELREIQSRGGKNSGAVRRRKADFRNTLNLLLTTKIDSPEWTPLLEALGLESTLESAMLMAQIKEAIMGNTKAAYFVAQYAGQSDKTDADMEEQSVRVEEQKTRIEKQKVDTEVMRAKAQLSDSDEIADDGFMEAIKGYAAEDWKEDEEGEAVL